MIFFSRMWRKAISEGSKRDFSIPFSDYERHLTLHVNVVSNKYFNLSWQDSVSKLATKS